MKKITYSNVTRGGILIALFFAMHALAFSQSDGNSSEQRWENGLKTFIGGWELNHLSEPDADLLKKKWNEISLPNDPGEDPFAGTYIARGELSGYFVRWSAKSGFVFVSFYDDTLICGYSIGRVEISGLKFRFVKQLHKGRSACAGDDSLKSPWIPADSGRYIIPSSSAAIFGRYFAGLGEFQGLYSKRFYDSPHFASKVPFEGAVNAKFLLPESYRHEVQFPISAKIETIGRKRIEKCSEETAKICDYGKRSEVNVKINAGSSAGVYKGMLFYVLSGLGPGQQLLQITKVAKDVSTGKVFGAIGKDGSESYEMYFGENERPVENFQVLKIGMPVTTSPMVWKSRLHMRAFRDNDSPEKMFHD